MATGYRKCPDCGAEVLKTVNQCLTCSYSFVGTGKTQPEEERKFAKVEIHTETHRIMGMIILGGSGYDFRLSDFLNTKAQRFFPLLDAAILGPSGDEIGRHEVMMVNKESVRLLIPIEEPQRDDNRLEGIVSSITHLY